MANAIPPLEVKVTVDTSDITKGLQETRKTVEDFGNTVKAQGSFLERFKASAAGVFAADMAQRGLSMLKASISEVIADAQAYERGLAKVNAVIEATGGIAGVTTEHIREQSAALESLAAVDENLITQAQGVLLTMTNVRNVMGEGNQVFDRATAAALDLSTVMEGDLQGATVLIGKALQDPIKGMSRLSRVGIDLSGAQETLIKKLMESGDMLGAQKVILEAVEKRYGGAAKAAGDTFAGAVARAKDKVSDFARDLTLQLQPILLKIGKTIGDLITKYVKPMVDWIVKNKEVILAMATAVGVMITALYAYRTAMIVVKVASEIYAVAQALLKGVQLASIASTNGLAASTLALNAAMRANPIGIVVTAATLLVGALVLLWNKSETFRKAVIAVGKAGLTAFASIIPIIGNVGEAMLKFITKPLQTLLSALSKLPGVGKYAKAGLDLLQNGLDGVSDFADKAAAKAKQLASDLDKLNKPIKISLTSTSTSTDKSGGNATAPSATDAAAAAAAKAAKAAAEKAATVKEYTKDIAGVYAEMNDVIAEAEAQGAEALEARNEQIAAAQERHASTVANITERYNEAKADAHARYGETVSNLNERYNEAMADADKRYTESVSRAQEQARKNEKEARERFAKRQVEIARQYNAKLIEAEKTLQEKIADIRASAARKATELMERATEKQASIVKQSVDRLRSAFSSKTGFDLGDAFGKGASGKDILGKLTAQLTASKNLAEKAQFLAANGFSQPFIEQVVSAGPEVGNALADSILQATPETIEALKTTFNEMETFSAHGLDTLAATMNAGGKLATSELMEAYTEVKTDLQKALDELNTEMTASLAEANAAYQASIVEAAATRDSELAEALADMTDALAKSNEALNEALADAQKSLAESRAEAQKNLSKGMADAQAALQKSLEEAKKDYDKGIADAQATLQKALADAQKEYEKKIDEINKATEKKLEQLKKKLAELAAELAKLAGAQAAADALGGAPTYTPLLPGGVTGGGGSTPGGSTSGGVSFTQNFTSTSVDTQAVTNATVSAIRFGNVIVPTAPTALAGKESGLIGAASIASRTVTVTPNPVRGFGRGAVAE